MSLSHFHFFPLTFVDQTSLPFESFIFRWNNNESKLPQSYINQRIQPFISCTQNIVPSGITEEVNELFVAENKLNLAVAEADKLPTISITKVTHHTGGPLASF